MKRHLRNAAGITSALAALMVVAALVALDEFFKRDAGGES